VNKFNGYGKQKVHPMQPQQITVDVKDQTPEPCSCGCVYFTPAVMVYKVSALMSPTGKELMAQRGVLLCMACNALYEQKANGEG
jgi:hypothetical protein